MIHGNSRILSESGYSVKALFMNPPQPETGVARIDFPTDMSGIAAAAASVNGRKYTTDIWVTLNPGGSAAGDGKAYVRRTQTGPVRSPPRTTPRAPSMANCACSDPSSRIPAGLSGHSTVRQISRADSTNDTSTTTAFPTRMSGPPSIRDSSGRRMRSRSGGRATTS
jgi:hypothetical protein